MARDTNPVMVSRWIRVPRNLICFNSTTAGREHCETSRSTYFFTKKRNEQSKRFNVENVKSVRRSVDARLSRLLFIGSRNASLFGSVRLNPLRYTSVFPACIVETNEKKKR